MTSPKKKKKSKKSPPFPAGSTSKGAMRSLTAGVGGKKTSKRATLKANPTTGKGKKGRLQGGYAVQARRMGTPQTKRKIEALRKGTTKKKPTRKR